MSTDKRLSVLCLGTTPQALAASPWGPFELHPCASLDDASALLGGRRFDAVVIAVDAARLFVSPALSQAVLESAVVVVTADPSPSFALRLLQRGVQDVVPANAANSATLGRCVRLAIERKSLETSARKAYATDLSTGLPNHAQLQEHMSQLFALRERESAPMALIALRIEGLATTEARFGTESVNVLRRKIAVRLRGALRASDVVASIGSDTFAVLLGWMDAPADGERVAAKLLQALRQPFGVAGQDITVATAVGVGVYPEHGKDAEGLLRRAVQQAGGQGVGRAGFSNVVERGPASAANDDES